MHLRGGQTDQEWTYTQSGWVTSFLAVTSSAPSLAYETAELLRYPWNWTCVE